MAATRLEIVNQSLSLRSVAAAEGLMRRYMRRRNIHIGDGAVMSAVIGSAMGGPMKLAVPACSGYRVIKVLDDKNF